MSQPRVLPGAFDSEQVIFSSALNGEWLPLEELSEARVQLVVVVGHSATQERTRAVAKRGLGIEVIRPGANDPGSLHLLTDNRPEVLILDVRLPEVKGEEIGAELRSQFPGLQVIVLAGYDHLTYLQALSRLGPAAFHRPAFDEAGVIGAARMAVNRRCLLSPELLLAPSEWLLEPLTAREYEILRLMAAGRHNRDIAGELGIAVKTVEFHIAHVMEKLGVHGRVEAILRARELGLGDGPSSGAA